MGYFSSNNVPDSIIKDLCYSFSFVTEQRLYPISNHRKYNFFREEKVREHAKKNLTDVNRSFERRIQGASKEEFQNDFFSNIGVDLKFISFVAEAEAKKSQISTTSSEFYQRHAYMTKKQLSHFGPFRTSEALKEHLAEGPYNSLMKIESKRDASDFISNFGFFYISVADIGGVSISVKRKKTHATTTKSWLTGKFGTQTLDGSAEVNTGLGAGQQTGASDEWEERTDRKFGGNAQKDGSKWSASIKDKNSDLCKCTFQPMYNLIDIGLDDGDELSKIREYLEHAYKDHNQSIPEVGSYKIRSVFSQFSTGPIGQSLFIVSEPREHKPLEPGLREDQEPRLVDGNDVPVNVFTLLAEERSDNGTECWDASFRSNYFYFGRRNRYPLQVKMSGEGNLLKGNQWILRKIPEKNEILGQRFLLCFDVKLRKQTFMLGVEETKKKAQRDSPVEYRYYVKKFKENKTIKSNFKWELIEYNGGPAEGGGDQTEDQHPEPPTYSTN